MPTPTQKYLMHYAEPESHELAGFPNLAARAVLAIPCFDETSVFVEKLQKQEFTITGSVLIILVINQPTDTFSEINNALMSFFRAWKCVWEMSNLCLYQSTNPKQHWLIVDRCQTGIPPKQGVGLARKIAADIACRLWSDNKLDGPWLHCTDADTDIPADYFFSPEPNFSACVFQHQHTPDPTDPLLTQATQFYQCALHYYVKGLQWAGSPYAFNTIGSTIAINLQHYTAVRGFPKRNAAEDFYLLNKLAKVGPIFNCETVQVDIQSRLSHRVPFGTGPAVASIMSGLAEGTPYCYYALECFYLLKEWLDKLPDVARTHSMPIETDPKVIDALTHLGIEQVLQHLKQQNSHYDIALKSLNDWFDGFRTLKFIRYLQGEYYPPQPIAHSYPNAPFNLTKSPVMPAS